MDADVMITTVFFLEVFLAGLAATVAVARGVRKATRQAAAEDDRDRGTAPAEAMVPSSAASRTSRNGADTSQLVNRRARRELEGVHR
jgi:hypothetical protein